MTAARRGDDTSSRAGSSTEGCAWVLGRYETVLIHLWVIDHDDEADDLDGDR